MPSLKKKGGMLFLSCGFTLSLRVLLWFWHSLYKRF